MSENSILENLEYDKISGSLTYKGVRYLLIRPETIIEFQKKMEESLGEKAKEGFYQGGFQGGFLSSKKYKEIFKFSNKQIIEFMTGMGTEIGWGHFSLDHFNFERGIIRVCVKQSPFIRPYEKSSTGTCDLIRGVIGGMASVIFNQTCTAYEIECTSKSSDKCVFLVNINSNADELLFGKRILVVDDEPDILESTTELLDMCIVETASDYKTASDLLEKRTYDAAILDIMGVKGYELLKITKNKKIPTLILTANALNPENFVKSIKKGAQAYIPKEKLFEIQSFLNDFLTDHPDGEDKTNRWFFRLKNFFNDKFGAEWKKSENHEFWEKNNFI